MRFVDLSLDAPQENLALDEVLLHSVAAGGPETLRLWESPVPFAVIGVGQALEDEVDTAACLADGVPYLRRCSAGGCVLQGLGSLNYTLALRLGARPELLGIRASYCALLGALIKAFAAQGLTLTHAGISDLALDGCKVSGNAQKRVKGALLHHGTLLYRADYAGMRRYLREPQDRPDYRGARRHDAFVSALPLDASALRAAVLAAFAPGAAPTPPTPQERAETLRLAADKYALAAWTERR